MNIGVQGKSLVYLEHDLIGAVFVVSGFPGLELDAVVAPMGLPMVHFEHEHFGGNSIGIRVACVLVPVLEVKMLA